MKIFVWNLNTFGGRDEQKYKLPKEDWADFAKDKSRQDIARRIFQRVRGNPSDIYGFPEFDCQAASAAREFIKLMNGTGCAPIFPKAGKSKEAYFRGNYSLPLCFVRKGLRDKVVPRLTLGSGEWARINEFKIGRFVFVAVHMNDCPKFWEELYLHAEALRDSPAMIAGDFNAYLPNDIGYSATRSEKFSKEFAQLLELGFIDLTPKGVSTYQGGRHIDHILISPALVRLFSGVEEQINSHINDPSEKVVIDYENGDAHLSVTIDRGVIWEGLSDHACLILDISLPDENEEA